MDYKDETMTVWNEWYKQKGYEVEPDIPYVSGQLNKNSRILDLGCGHGRHVIHFAAKGHELYGADNYDAVLKRLDARLRKNGLSAHLKTLDITKKLPYKKNFFDLVIATRSIHHTDNKNVKKIFKEMDKVLKHGGIIFLQVPGYEYVEKNVKTREMYGKKVDIKWTEPHTYIPQSGPERGIAHHSFNKKELQSLLSNYRFLRIHSLKKHYHGYCVVAKKK